MQFYQESPKFFRNVSIDSSIDFPRIASKIFKNSISDFSKDASWDFLRFPSKLSFWIPSKFQTGSYDACRNYFEDFSQDSSRNSLIHFPRIIRYKFRGSPSCYFEEFFKNLGVILVWNSYEISQRINFKFKALSIVQP